MSLLMDALRRAEQEKQQQEQAREADVPAAPVDAAVEAPYAGSEDVTMQIEPSAVEQASNAVEPGMLDLEPDAGDDSRTFTMERRNALRGDDSTAVDLAGEGDHSRSMPRPLELEPMTSEPGDGGGSAPDAAGRDASRGDRSGDDSATVPSPSAVARDLDSYFDRSHSLEAPGGTTGLGDKTLEDVAAHTVVGARTVFAASRRPRANRLLIAAAALAVAVVLGIGVIAVFFARQSPGVRHIPPPTVAEGVERAPARELPVVPLEQPAAPELPALPRVDTRPPAPADAAAGAVGAEAGDAAPPAEAAREAPAASSGQAAAAQAPETAQASEAPPAASPATRTASAERPATSPAPAAAPPPAAPSVDIGAGEVRIAREHRPAGVDAKVAAAYEAFQSGDLETAEARYRALLAEDPERRDALLGLGALAVARGDAEAAFRRYSKVLERHPEDAVASAALFSLTGGKGEATAARLRMLLDHHADVPYIHFALGNWYARQQRWGDAQQAYFEALRLDPDNADYAYNLAISLDRMGQAKAALDYYRKSLELADVSRGGFNASAVLERIRDLSHAAAP